MNKKRATLEVIAPSIEEAIAKGLNDLGLSENDVEIEILDEGSRGLFGLGGRQARIRITIKSAHKIEGENGAVPEASLAETIEPAETMMQPSSSIDATMEEAQTKPSPSRSVQDDIILHVARETVSELLDKMQVKAEVTSYFGESDEPHGRIPVKVDIHGNDLSILIGRQAETLNALQYIAGLIVGKELGHTVTLIIDVEGYRQRREQQIRQLARRMADQAVSTGRRQVLEPMPANERRLVHIELRDNPHVTTESIGEDPHRKVTIIPK
jgi:spoIIIJ-associated protein